MLKHGGHYLSVVVSSQALEHIDPSEYGDARSERFTEYRGQFEQIAKDKFERGLTEHDGTLCVRGRDLPGQGN